MTIGDKGVVISIDAGGYNMTGSTASLVAAPGEFPSFGAGTNFGPVTVVGDGLFGAYETTGADFLAGGYWTLWLQVKTATGQTFTSDPGTIYVNPLPTMPAAA